MKKYIKQIAFSILIITFSSCGNDDNIESTNQSPEGFNVTASAETKGLGINLEWNTPIDPDGDTLTYDIIVDSNVISENIAITSHTFLALAYNTITSGSVIAKDGIGGERSIPFSVTSSSLVDIPDPNFEAFLIDSNIDLDGEINGQMDYGQALEFTILDMSEITPNINDLKGIEAFINLKDFNFTNQNITTIDLSRNIQLERLDCSNTDLTSIELTNNSKLKIYTGVANSITSIDFSKNVELREIDVEGNEFLTELDLTKNVELIVMNCGGASLTTIDLSNNTKLKHFYCYENSFNSLNLINNLLLETLSCSVNNLSSLDLSANINLDRLFCGQNSLSILNLSQNSQLLHLFCNNNNLTSLNIQNGNSQNIQNFNATNNPNLTSVCIDVLVPVNPELSSGVDTGVSFSTICN